MEATTRAVVVREVGLGRRQVTVEMGRGHKGSATTVEKVGARHLVPFPVPCRSLGVIILCLIAVSAPRCCVRGRSRIQTAAEARCGRVAVQVDP